MGIEHQETFEFLRLTSFSSFDKNFKKELIANLSDTEHMKFSRQRLVRHNDESLESYFNSVIEHGGQYYLIREIRGQKAMGTFTLNPTFENSCDVGILIFREFTNAGVGFLVFSKVFNLVKSLGYREMVAGSYISNFKMRRLCERLGMTLDSRKNFPNGNFEDISNIYFVIKC